MTSAVVGLILVGGIATGRKPDVPSTSNQLSSFRFTIASDEMSVGVVNFRAKRHGWTSKRWYVDIAESDCETATCTFFFGGYGSFEGRFYKMWREDTDRYSFWLVTPEGKRFRLRASNMHGEKALVSCVDNKAGMSGRAYSTRPRSTTTITLSGSPPDSSRERY